VGGVQLTRAGKLSGDSEPRRGRIHWPGEVKVSRDEHSHEETPAEFRSESRARRRWKTHSSIRV